MPVFFNNEAITSAPNLCAGIDDKEPPNDPRAVLVAATITISRFILITFLKSTFNHYKA